MEVVPGQGRMKYRGEVGPNDDPVSFKQLMEDRGHRVVITGTFKGLEYQYEDED